jgi:uncharacterized membrane protein
VPASPEQLPGHGGPSMSGRGSSRLIGLIATVVTAGVVSWATPDGNLVVTLVPALLVGGIAFGIASWRFRRARRHTGEP